MEVPLLSRSKSEPLDKLFKSLADLDDRHFELWRYFEDRADLLTARLWTTGSWLVGILVAVLSLPFAAHFVAVTGGAFPLKPLARLPLALIAIFGVAFSVFAFVAITDLREHIEQNWTRAMHIRRIESKETGHRAYLQQRKKTGWQVLLGIIVLAFAGFLGLILVALLP
jgi:hypothetical protein